MHGPILILHARTTACIILYSLTIIAINIECMCVTLYNIAHYIGIIIMLRACSMHLAWLLNYMP